MKWSVVTVSVKGKRTVHKYSTRDVARSRKVVLEKLPFIKSATVEKVTVDS